jgi:hypothetical protein
MQSSGSGHANFSKNNENSVFRDKTASMAGKIGQFFSHLDCKFVTPRINGNFHGINELKPR